MDSCKAQCVIGSKVSGNRLSNTIASGRTTIAMEALSLAVCSLTNFTTPSARERCTTLVVGAHLQNYQIKLLYGDQAVFSDSPEDPKGCRPTVPTHPPADTRIAHRGRRCSGCQHKSAASNSLFRICFHVTVKLNIMS